MRNRTVKSLSFKNDCPFESQLLAHANNYPNFAAYVKRLIQRDLEGGVNPSHKQVKKNKTTGNDFV